jgi:hypothetical protein
MQIFCDMDGSLICNRTREKKMFKYIHFVLVNTKNEFKKENFIGFSIKND